jgi:hypothetical protein
MNASVCNGANVCYGTKACRARFGRYNDGPSRRPTSCPMIYVISIFVVIMTCSFFVSLCVPRRLSVKRVGILLMANAI